VSITFVLPERINNDILFCNADWTCSTTEVSEQLYFMNMKKEKIFHGKNI
jgi:hypothetical protein